jgi:hypothetical protein
MVEIILWLLGDVFEEVVGHKCDSANGAIATKLTNFALIPCSLMEGASLEGGFGPGNIT